MASGDIAPPVVVGYDGSKQGERALRWGVEEARHRWTSLVICHAWHWPYPMPPSEPAMLQTVQDIGRHVLDQGVYVATGMAPGLPVRTRLIAGPASAALVSESQGARLVVLGTRGLGGFDQLRVGATAMQVSAHAACPVIVVSGAGCQWSCSPPLVVAGVDGSPAGFAAVGFAAEEAALREGSLLAVCAGLSAAPPTEEPLDSTPDPDLRAKIEGPVWSALSLWRERYPRVRMDASFVATPPRQALRDAGANACLLVVGDRGIETDRPPLGPVTQAMLHHAPCPVAVVR